MTAPAYGVLRPVAMSKRNTVAGYSGDVKV